MKILLVNFSECPENLHFEQAFIRALRGAKNVSLDIVHDFQFHYSFIDRLPPPGGRRLGYSAPADLKRELRASHDTLVFLDFPGRKACAAPFLSLLRGFPRSRKIFVANHLIPMPGQNLAADIAGKLGILRVLNRAFIFEFDDRGRWAGLGIRGDRIAERGYAVDCRYYTPANGSGAARSYYPARVRGERRCDIQFTCGNSVFSAGSAGRDFAGLARAVKNAGRTLNIFSDAPVPPFPAGLRASAVVSPLSKNLHNLRQAVRASAAVVVPIADGYINEAAGNSIAFIAMACGKPVIIRKTPYLERFIRDGETGFFYETLSVPDLSRQLDRALSLNRAAARRLAAAARATILKKASLDAFAARLARECL